MGLLCSKGLCAAVWFILSVSAAWANPKCYALMETSYLSLSSQYLKASLPYMPLFILLDIVFSLAVIYSCKKAINQGVKQLINQAVKQ